MANISHFTQTVNGVSTTYDIHDANALPRSGGAVMTGSVFGRTSNDLDTIICGGTDWAGGASIALRGKYYSIQVDAGWFIIRAFDGTYSAELRGGPSGSLSWNGQPVQYASDQRLKQQITEIDDKLLDAWESVELSQFKYNDAVGQKGKDKARLHTGYVVQQIDSACKSHGVDVSAYGLYCHEEYPEETEEVEVEQKDGTKTKKKKVIRKANEHYSLRYTEVYAVECMYLRRCIKQLTTRIERLTARIEQLEKGKGQEASK